MFQRATSLLITWLATLRGIEVGVPAMIIALMMGLGLPFLQVVPDTKDTLLHYTATPLGRVPLTGDELRLTGLNDKGQIVGCTGQSIGGHAAGISHGFVWYRGKFTPLRTLTGKQTYPFAINNRGDVVGWAESGTRTGYEFHDIKTVSLPVLWRLGDLPDLPLGDLPWLLSTESGRALGVNDTHEVVGKINGAVFLKEGNNQALESGNSEAVAINNRGEIIGNLMTVGPNSSLTSGENRGQYNPFRYAEGKLQWLNLGTAISGKCSAINDSGDIVGFIDLSDRQRHACLWRNGVLQDLGTLGGNSSGAVGVNEKGDIVGWSEDKQGRSRACLWHDGTVVDLNLLIVRFKQADLVSAKAINNLGQILTLRYSTNLRRKRDDGFLLTPVPVSQRMNRLKRSSKVQ